MRTASEEVPNGRTYRIALLCLLIMAFGGDPAHAQDNAAEPSAHDRTSGAEKEWTDSVSAVRLPTLRVTGEPAQSYYVHSATTGTRMPMPIEDVPRFIGVVSQRILEVQDIIYPNQALRNVSGIATDQAVYSAFQRYNVRGFRVRHFYKNGLLEPGLSRTFWLGNIARLEILKGPSSSLYGGSFIGGVINYITKMPLAEPTFTASTTLGSYDFTSALFDVSGPLTEDKSISYRLIGELMESDSFIHRFHTTGRFLYGVMDIWLNDDTNLIIRSELRARNPEQFGRVGLPAVGTVLNLDEVNLPISRNYNEPFARRENFSAYVGMELTHRLNDIWSFRSHTRVTHFNFSQHRISPSLFKDPKTGDWMLARNLFIVDDIHNDYRTNNTAIARFQTGSIEHQLLLGLTLAHQPISYENKAADLAPISIVHPVFGAQPKNIHPRNDNSIDINTAGIYAQDFITLFPNLKLILGGRYDYVYRHLSDSVQNVEKTAEDTEFSPQVGLVYEAIPGVSFYASYSTSFRPVGSFISIRSRDTLQEPETGTQYELGMKLYINQRLAATLAAYHLTREDVLTPSPTVPDLQVPVGEQRSRGIELDLTYKIMDGWNVLAAYAYTDAEVTEDNRPKRVGNRPKNVPKHMGRLWSSYSVQSGALAGLTFGAGLYYVGERYGDSGNTFKLDPYTIVDATISYPWDWYSGSYKASLLITNLLDEEYIEASASRSSVFPGQPLSAYLTLSATF